MKLLHSGHVYLLVFAVVTAGVGAVWSTKIPFNYDVLAMLPKDSEAVYYQRKMVEESDFQAETVLFTASTMEEARRLADEAAQASFSGAGGIVNLPVSPGCDDQGRAGTHYR